MPLSLYAVFGAMLLSLFPAQTRQISSQAKSAASGFGIETGEACTGLSHEECCGQKLEMASFRSQGDYLRGPVKTMVLLACRDEHHVVTPQVCRSIVTSRGFASDVDSICKPAQRECQKDGTCRQCMADLSKLDYHGSHNACHALTYVPSRPGSRVVVLQHSGGTADSDTRFQVSRRRPLR